jgi:hypothetical protein
MVFETEVRKTENSMRSLYPKKGVEKEEVKV